MNLSKSHLGAVVAVLGAFFFTPTCLAENLNVVAVHNAPQELALKKRLEQLVAKYKLEKWLYTRDIRIDQDVWPPHSHPVLTLGVRDSQFSDDLYLVGGLLHEEFHWNMVLNSKLMPDETAALVKAKFPGLNPRRPNGSGDEISTYNHVLVCYMEYKALASIFGEADAKKAVRELPFYTDIYALVSDSGNQKVIEDLLLQEEVNI